MEARVSGDGSPVLLIHGTAAAVWGEVPERLAAAGHQVIDYDRRGFGASAGEPGAALRDHVADAAALLEGRPARVVGWSIGGVIGLELAVAHPELVRGLVIVDAPLHAKRHPRPRMLAAIARAQLARDP